MTKIYIFTSKNNKKKSSYLPTYPLKFIRRGLKWMKTIPFTPFKHKKIVIVNKQFRVYTTLNLAWAQIFQKVLNWFE